MIVNADDYGHTPGVSAGIRYSHLHGVVTSTTAMMNMPGVGEDLLKALQECPRLGLGVHLVLTTGTPSLPPSQVKSLVKDDGSFSPVSDQIHRLPSLDLHQVKAEWRAQIESFITVTGHSPDHLDSHHHISFLSPQIFLVMLELAQTYDCAIRFPTGEAAVDMLSEFPPAEAGECLQSNLRLVNQYQPRRPDTFISSFYDAHARQVELLHLLENLPAGTTEIMCHPGYSDEALVARSVYGKPREAELSILTDQDVIRFFKIRDIQLVNFGDLQPVGMERA